ncbi:MAG: rhomboid family intramembrane serine protease [Myxococcota bacterium]
MSEHPPQPESPNVLWGLMGLNVLVYTLWHTVGIDHPALFRAHLTVSWESVAAGRLWTLLTSELSHVDATHLLANLLGLYVFGLPVLQVLGGRGLAGLYVFGALAASLGFVAWGALTGDPAVALGASGAVSAIAVCYALWFPRRTLLLMFFIPLPAWLAVLAFIVLDVLGLFVSGVDGLLMGRDVRIAHSAHLGGAVAGLVVGLPVWWRNRAAGIAR